VKANVYARERAEDWFMNAKNSHAQVILDHMVVVVSDLEEAIENFSSLGFLVERGGVNGPTHNALIFFRDGTYIELISTISPRTRAFFRLLCSTGIMSLLGKIRPSITQRFFSWFSQPPGLRDWCFRTSSLDNTIAHLRANGIEALDAKQYSRTRPDGEVATWRLAGTLSRNLPFFIEDETPTEVRVPYKDACQHPNGVGGISAVVLPRDQGQKALQALKHCNIVESTDGEECRIDGVAIRLADSPAAPVLALEVKSSGELKGSLSSRLTSNALIEVA